MSTYLHKFYSNNDFNNQYFTNEYTHPWVSLTLGSKKVNYNKLNTNGHKYVDLGLPSGTLWATMNLGATTPEEVGDYYMWGDINPGPSSRYDYDDEHYKWYSNGEYIKYNQTDGKYHLDLEDDAAHVNMGGDWHIPTMAQLEELISETTYSSIVDNGSSELVLGMKFTSKSDPSKYIIFPAGDYKWESGYSAYLRTCIPTNEITPDLSGYEFKQQIYVDFYLHNPTNHYMPRSAGFNVRGVIDVNPGVPLGFIGIESPVRYTVNSSSFINPVIDSNKFVLINGKVEVIQKYNSSSYISSTDEYANKEIVGQILIPGKKDWKYAISGYYLSDFGSSFFNPTYSESIIKYSKVLLGMDGRYYTLTKEGDNASCWYTLSGTGEFNGYKFGYNKYVVSSQGNYFVKPDESAWYQGPVWALFLE